MPKHARTPSPCICVGCTHVTTSDSGLCRACQLVDPRLLELRQADDLARVKSSPGRSGQWASAQKRLQATQTISALPVVPETVCEAPEWQSSVPAGDCVSDFRQAITSTPFIVALAVIALGVLGVWCYANNEQAGIAQAQEVGK